MNQLKYIDLVVGPAGKSCRVKPGFSISSEPNTLHLGRFWSLNALAISLCYILV